MIVRGLHEHCTAVEIPGSRKTILIPRIELCPSDPTTPFKQRRRRFQINIACASTINEAQGQKLKRAGIYASSPNFFTNGHIYGAFSQHYVFDNVTVAIIECRQHTNMIDW